VNFKQRKIYPRYKSSSIRIGSLTFKGKKQPFECKLICSVDTEHQMMFFTTQMEGFVTSEPNNLKRNCKSTADDGKKSTILRNKLQ